MITRIYAKKIASRRYQVLTCIPIASAIQIQSLDGSVLMINSNRPYRKGVIINPTKVTSTFLSRQMEIS